MPFSLPSLQASTTFPSPGRSETGIAEDEWLRLRARFPGARGKCGSLGVICEMQTHCSCMHFIVIYACSLSDDLRQATSRSQITVSSPRRRKEDGRNDPSYASPANETDLPLHSFCRVIGDLPSPPTYLDCNNMCTPCARQIPLFLKSFSPSARTRPLSFMAERTQIITTSNRYIRGKTSCAVIFWGTFALMVTTTTTTTLSALESMRGRAHEMGGSFHVVVRRMGTLEIGALRSAPHSDVALERTSAISEYGHSRCLRLSLTWRVTPTCGQGTLDYTITRKMPRGYSTSERRKSWQFGPFTFGATQIPFVSEFSVTTKPPW
jgi:hypothetical protein